MQLKSNKNCKYFNIPAPIPDENSIQSPVATSSVVPSKFKELRMLHNLRRARKAADSNLGSPVNRDNTPISSIREPVYKSGMPGIQ